MNKTLLTIFTLQIGLTLTFAQGNSGLVLDSPREYESIPKANLPVGADLSPIRHKDLSQNFPKIGNQLSHNSCVGWALCYYLRTFHEKSIHDADITNNNHIISPFFLYSSLSPRRNNDCTSGIRISRALKFLKEDGSVPLSVYSIRDCNIKPDDLVRDEAKKFRISDYARVPDVNNLSYLKLFINSHYPVIVGANINEKFKSLKKGEVLTDFRSPTDSHALIVVGYDETTPIKKFKVINSWGAEWGDDGYAWIEYEAFRNMVDQAWIVYPNETNLDSVPAFVDNIVVQGEENKIDDSQSFYRFWIETNNIISNNIEKVIYKYNDSFFAVRTNTVTTKHNSFSGKYIGSRCAENITASLLFKNSITKDITFNLCDVIKKTAQENSLVGSSKTKSFDFTPIVTVEYKRKMAGKKWYNFSITPTGIDQFKSKITKFVYKYNHPTLNNKTSTNKNKNFSSGYYGWGCVTNLSIEMHYLDNDNNQKVSVKNINMCENIGWVDVSEKDNNINSSDSKGRSLKVSKKINIK